MLGTLGIEVYFDAVYSPASLSQHKKPTMTSISTLLLRIKEDFHIELNELSKITFLDSNAEVLQNAKSLGC